MEIYFQILFRIALFYSLISFVYATYFGIYFYKSLDNENNKVLLIQDFKK